MVVSDFADGSREERRQGYRGAEARGAELIAPILAIWPGRSRRKSSYASVLVMLNLLHSATRSKSSSPLSTHPSEVIRRAPEPIPFAPQEAARRWTTATREEEMPGQCVRRRNHRGSSLPSRVPDSGLGFFHAVSAYCVICSQMLMVVVVAFPGVTTPGLESRSRC